MNVAVERWGLAAAVAVVASGLVVALAPFGTGAQAALLAHVLGGVLGLPLVVAYAWSHVARLRAREDGAALALGWIASALLAATLVTGLALAAAYAANRFGVARVERLHRVAAIALVVALPLHGATSRRAVGAAAATARTAPRATLAGSAAAAIATAAIALAAHPPPRTVPVPPDYPRSEDGSIFGPSLVTTRDGGFVAVAALTGSERCGDCHREIFAEWASSTHRFAGMDNELIAAATKPAEAKRGLAAARFCASCHEPVAFLAGEVRTSSFDIPDATRRTGVTCLVCHGVAEVPGSDGNGQMVYAPPDTFAFFGADGRLGATLHRVVVRGFEDEHRRAMRPAVLAQSNQCSSCHTVNADAGFNGFGFVRLHQENDDWEVSGFGRGLGIEKRVVRCHDCHMGQVAPSQDPVAARKGAHRSHRFLAANTLVAKLHGGAEQLALTERFLRGDGFPAEVADVVPAGPIVGLALEAPAPAEPGRPLAFALLLSNRSVGHAFPAGPNEVQEAWLDVRVTDAEGRELFASGWTDPATGERDPDAFALTAIPVDAEGNEIFVTAGLSAGFRFRNALAPAETQRVPVALTVPTDVTGPLSVAARVRYRKSDAAFTKLVARDFRPGLTLADVPVTDVATLREAIPIAPAAAS